MKCKKRWVLIGVGLWAIAASFIALGLWLHNNVDYRRLEESFVDAGHRNYSMKIDLHRYIVCYGEEVLLESFAQSPLKRYAEGYVAELLSEDFWAKSECILDLLEGEESK